MEEKKAERAEEKEKDLLRMRKCMQQQTLLRHKVHREKFLHTQAELN